MKSLLLMFCFFEPLFSEINVLDLKNTFACLQGTENEMLSPLVGAVSWHSDWMKNFYRFGDPETACVKLARELFYYNEQTGHFAITKSISALAAFLVQNNATDLLISWYANNRKNLNELVHYKNQLAKNIKGFSKREFQKLRDKWFRESKGDFLNDVQKRLADSTPPNYKLLTQIENAFYELYAEKIPFPPFVLDQILATYWFIAQPDKDSIPAYMELLLGEKCPHELPASYVSVDLRKIIDYTRGQIEELFRNNPEELAVFLCDVLRRGKNPPFVDQKNYACGSRVDIPDCVESTLRNFFNFILFDGNRYNFDLLPEKISAHVDPQLREFYDKFQLEETLSGEAGQTWFSLISSLHEKDASIRYTAEKCELDGDEENVVKVINALLNTDATGFYDFAPLLSTVERQIIVEQKSSEKYSMNIEDRSAQFLLEKGHAECKFVSALKEDVNLNSVFEIVVHEPTILSLLLLTLDPSLLLTGHYFDDHNYLALGRNLANPNVLVDIIESITKILLSENPDQESYCSWISALLSDLHRKDETLYKAGLVKLMKAYDYLAPCAKDLIDKEKSPQELLFIAAEFGGSKSFIEHVLAQGAQIDEDRDGNMALILAARYGQTDAVKALLDAGAKVDEINKVGYTALMYAAWNGHAEIAKALLAAGAKVDEKDKYDGTALMYAARGGHTETVLILLAAGAKVDEKDKYSHTALMKAVMNGHAETVKTLLAAGAKVDEKVKYGNTELMIAAGGRCTETVKAFLVAGAKVDEKNEYGYTALMFAARYGRTGAVKILLDAGANITEKNNEGQTALTIAKQTGQEEIIDILTKALEREK